MIKTGHSPRYPVRLLDDFLNPSHSEYLGRSRLLFAALASVGRVEEQPRLRKLEAGPSH
jgi:hypothetical protein